MRKWKRNHRFNFRLLERKKYEVRIRERRKFVNRRKRWQKRIYTFVRIIKIQKAWRSSKVAEIKLKEGGGAKPEKVGRRNNLTLNKSSGGMLDLKTPASSSCTKPHFSRTHKTYQINHGLLSMKRPDLKVRKMKQILDDDEKKESTSKGIFSTKKSTPTSKSTTSSSSSPSKLVPITTVYFSTPQSKKQNGSPRTNQLKANILLWSQSDK